MHSKRLMTDIHTVETVHDRQLPEKQTLETIDDRQMPDKPTRETIDDKQLQDKPKRETKDRQLPGKQTRETVDDRQFSDRQIVKPLMTHSCQTNKRATYLRRNMRATLFPCYMQFIMKHERDTFSCILRLTYLP